MLLLVEPGVDVECLGDEPHQVPVLGEESSIMEHSCLAVVLAVAVGVAVVISGKEETIKNKHCLGHLGERCRKIERFQEKSQKEPFIHSSMKAHVQY